MKEVVMDKNVEVVCKGAFDNCHIGCDCCDFVTYCHTKYNNGKATGLTLTLECENAEQCEHLINHIKEGMACGK